VNYVKLENLYRAVLKIGNVDFKLNQIWPVSLFNKNNHDDFNPVSGKFYTSNREVRIMQHAHYVIFIQLA
jgi:hypothetical protein